MALKKQIELPTGVTGDYWRDIQLNISFLRDDSVMTLELYHTEETRRAGKPPMNSPVTINLDGEFLQAEINGMTLRALILQQAYNAFMRMAQAEAEKPVEERTWIAGFADALDV